MSVSTLRRRLPRTVLAAAGLAAGIASGAQAVTPGLSIAADKRSFVDGSGKPFYWLADTAWSMLFSLTPPDVDNYLAVRKAQGFNTVLLQLLADPGTPDRTMHIMFKRDAQKRPILSQPDPVFFANARAKIRQINDAGMVAVVVLAWGTNVGTIFDATSARTYGKLIGQSFGDQNVVWMLGGDVNPTPDQVEIWQSMADGVRAGEPVRRLMTYHGRSGSSSQWFASDPRIDFNSIQSGHARWRTSTNRFAGIVRQDYDRVQKPVVDQESGYEHLPMAFASTAPATPVSEEDRIDAYDVRVRAYQQLLSGAGGYTYGQADVVRFYDVGGKVKWPNMDVWRKAMLYPAASQLLVMQIVRKLIGTPALIPNDGLVVEQTKVKIDYNRTIAGCSPDGSRCLIYDTAGAPVVVKRDGGRAFVWIDPRTGMQLPALPSASTSTTLTFVPPPGPVAPTPVTIAGQRSPDDWLLLVSR